jgi:hypothetical protein
MKLFKVEVVLTCPSDWTEEKAREYIHRIAVTPAERATVRIRHEGELGERLFYIRNRWFCGDCLVWWRAGGSGYTTDLREAWAVPESQAAFICTQRPKEDRAYPKDEVDAVTAQHANSEHPYFHDGVW